MTSVKPPRREREKSTAHTSKGEDMKKRMWKFPLFVAVFGLLLLVRVDATMAQATTVTTETTVDISTTVDSCPLGEPVQLTG